MNFPGHSVRRENKKADKASKKNHRYKQRKNKNTHTLRKQNQIKNICAR